MQQLLKMLLQGFVTHGLITILKLTITELLSLLYKIPTRRWYSPSLLAMSALLQSVSPACYKQIISDGFVTFPSVVHMKRLTSAIDINSPSSIAYLTVRFRKLDEKDNLVSILMDEVYSHKVK